MTTYAMQTRDELHYWLAAVHMPQIGPIKIKRWLQHWPSLTALMTAHPSEWQQAGMTAADSQRLQQPDWRAVEDDLQWQTQPDCYVIPQYDPRYPLLLKETPNPPLVLYARGARLDALTAPQLAMVGTRHPTADGKELAWSFAKTLTQAGLVITSGLAAGIDGASHQGALDGGGLTIAVTGAGLQHIYPRSHRRLAERIAANGVVLSEFPPDVLPMAQHFPQRNRIISGMALGVLVVEAALKSGSLITARFAGEQGRDVFAIPGSIHNPLARGCHQLIQQGAKLIETTQDIIDELSALAQVVLPQALSPLSKKDQSLDKKQREFLTNISYAATPIDKIITRSGLTAAQVSSMLLTLELQGWVVKEPGGYTRTSRDSC